MQIEPFKIEEQTLLAEGEASFQIIKAEDNVSKGRSKKGLTDPDQLKVTFRLWDKNNKEGFSIDYFPYRQDMLWKLGKLLQAIALEKLSETGNIDPLELNSRAGKCNIFIDDSEGFDKKTRIQSYLKKEIIEETIETSNFDDDIPFG